ncbi:S8 family serine peptidase [uncultured Winogradskyella sp.]|uniref:S8 family serine peptidase n=1 Tax=uncultured Winogradskyella sp. TaxID=395353 RepID=UPI0030D821BC|tara:strand:+ start:196541 stop:198502 length:1962 start_codon:yes stop_codon:yes gene_type:complete
MKLRILLLLVCFVQLSFSQDRFSYDYNENLSKENNALMQRLLLKEYQRNQKVSAYLAQNPMVNKFLYNDTEVTSELYDIINGKPVYLSIDNLEAARATKTAALQPGGITGYNLTGAGMTVGVWDGGPVQNDHPEFMTSGPVDSRIDNRDITLVDGDTGFSNHGTHVSGTIAASGNSAAARGMATGVIVKSYNWSNDDAEVVAAINDLNAPIILSNHSYGIPITQNDGPLDSFFMGAYTGGARAVDDIIHNNPQYLMVISAGNDGNTTYPDGMFPGYDKLTGNKNAKNALIVANANPQLMPFSDELAQLPINSGSSQGPTDDLRIKPDIAADGTNLFSTISNSGYATFTGTSMAAPNTTGSLVLIQEYYEQVNGAYMNSATLKGLICHTSVDDIFAPGPDPKFGWGFLDALASVNTINDDTNGESVIDELNLAQGETYSFTFSASAGDNLSATISWVDLPANPSTGILNDPTSRLVNDLDLRITKDGVDYLPWKLDYSSTSGFSNSKGDNLVDNIERVDIEAPETGIYTLTVSHKGTLQGNAGGPFSPQTQDFSLILTGNNLTLSVLENNLDNSLLLFPNPSKGEFTINFDSHSNEDIKIEVYDLSGRQVYNKIYSNNSSKFNERIVLNNVQTGVYIAKISEGNRFTSQKLIID